MKKLFAILLTVVMLAAMCVVPTSAAGVYKTYAEAQNGDLLWIVDFNDTATINAQPNDSAKENMSFTIGDNGRSVTVKGISGKADNQRNYWGGAVKGLEVTGKDTATMTFKVKANGTTGKNNSTGIGG